MSKELFMAAHEELIEKYLEKHPEATEAEAYDKTADGAYGLMADRIADMIDYHRQKAKDGQL
jgi:hypothetical protein